MQEKINIEWLTEMTGDPFADAGGLVIQFFRHLPEFKGKTTLEIIEYVANVYINEWEGKLHPFFLNSPVTQAAFTEYEWEGERYSAREIKKMKLSDEQLNQARREDRKVSETVSYYQGLIDETVTYKVGYCEISGKKTKLFPAGRNNQILGGSGTFVNFYPNLQAAAFLSKECIIRMFFVPLGIHRLADKLALVVSNNQKVGQFFVFQNCLNNWSALKLGTSKGPIKSSFKNPANALFRFVDDYVQHLGRSMDIEEKTEFDPYLTSLSFYHFSNLGQGPDLGLYSMDNEVFSFYTYCNGQYKKEWQQFIASYYHPDNFKKSIFNEVTKAWETKEGEEITFEEYEKWKNFVLNALLNKISLLKYFLRWSKKNILPLDLIKTYQITMRGMKKETIEKIDSIATFIVDKDMDYMEEIIDSLNNVMSRDELRKVFLDLQVAAYKANVKEALISAEDYILYLFPEGGSWREVRDLLLISIYQIRNQDQSN